MVGGLVGGMVGRDSEQAGGEVFPYFSYSMYCIRVYPMYPYVPLCTLYPDL